MVAFLFFSIFIIVKNIYAWYMYSTWVETKSSAIAIAFGSFQNDMYMVVFIFFIALLSIKKAFKFLLPIIWFIVIVLTLLTFVDLQTLYTFNRRLILTDMLKFSDHGMESYFVLQYMQYGFGLILISAPLTYIYIQFRTGLTDKILLLFLGISLLIPIQIHYLKGNYLVKNFIQNNMSITYYKKYSNTKELHQNFLKSFKMIDGKNEKANIIVIFAESWSAVDSNRTSGINLGHLSLYDKISQEGRLYKNFFSEASTTDQAYVSVLTGLPPLLYSLDTKSYTPYYYKNNLVNMLNYNGYFTSFIKAHELDFLGLRSFLKYLKFDEMIGKEEAFVGQETYTMGGVSDDVLYDYILEHISTMKEPYYLNITTLSTHIPFYSPKGWGEENAYTYADGAFNRFYKKLKKSGYLKNNYLLLFGDHRKMTPLNIGEYEKYKESSYSRVVATLWGAGIQPSIDTNYYNLTDISYSIEWLISKNIALPKDYNNIFTQEIKRDFVIHDSFENRSEVSVFTPNSNEESIITLDGDKTSIIKGKLNQEAVKYINNIRGNYQYMKSRE